MSSPNESVNKAIKFIANELAKKRPHNSTGRPKLIDLVSERVPASLAEKDWGTRLTT
jgi:hypothetical protein